MSEIKRWAASGISIDANELDVEALARFATLALQEFPGQKVQVSEHGTLRVTRHAGQDGGPYLDWRD